MSKQITLLHLYADDMSVYGDKGNIASVAHRLKLYGYEPKIIEYNPGDILPEQVDIIIGGGGQDSGQLKIQDDLYSIAPRLSEWAEGEVPMLMICGLYQLFGNEFITHKQESIKGIGIFDITTKASSARLIGNIVTDSSEFGTLVGYENHSGKTYLGDDVKPLARVIKGAGNNGEDITEGARYKKIIGSYMHGPILPKNPTITDFLIQKAVTRRYQETLQALPNNNIVEQARLVAINRKR
jgi:CobQ-like glutamine amidotransferase family enzyme